MQTEPSVVQSIRLPRELWNEIQKQAQGSSFNKVVNELLKKQLEQDKKTQEKKVRV